MTSQSEIKRFSSLKLKKFRQKYGLFLVEGVKSVTELLASSFTVQEILMTENLDLDTGEVPVSLLSRKDMERLSSMETPPGIMAVAEVPQWPAWDATLSKGPILALDGIRDPGNLGTIMRIADWYGMNQLLLSEDCTDVFNPKTLQASMGSFLRIQCHYGKLPSMLKEAQLPVYGCTLNGKNIRTMRFPERFVVVIGSESHGISHEVMALIDEAITIPRFGHAESLNAAIATALVLDRCIQ
jgi:TrmH family RNA methyltransferase